MFVTIPAIGHVQHVKNVDKLEQVLSQNELVIIKFSATWCGPCKRLTPIFDKISHNVTITCIEIDVDACQEIAQKYAIRSMPTLIFIRNGNVLARTTGTMTYHELREKIRSIFNI
jgi:Thioredoxin domain-containing protein